MEPPTENFDQLGSDSKRLAKRLLVIGENRLELLLVEIQEERNRFLHALGLALGVAVSGLLAGVSLTIVLVVVLWESSPIAALMALTGLYAATALYLYRCLKALRRDWQTLPATFDQLRKDRECLVRSIA